MIEQRANWHMHNANEQSRKLYLIKLHTLVQFIISNAYNVSFDMH